MTQPRGAYGPCQRRMRDSYVPSNEPAYRRKIYAEKHAKTGVVRRKYIRIEVSDYMPIAKERVVNDPLRKWVTGPDLWALTN